MYIFFHQKIFILNDEVWLAIGARETFYGAVRLGLCTIRIDLNRLAKSLLLRKDRKPNLKGFRSLKI